MVLRSLCYSVFVLSLCAEAKSWATELWVIRVVAKVLIAKPQSGIVGRAAQKISLIAFHLSFFYLLCPFYTHTHTHFFNTVLHISYLYCMCDYHNQGFQHPFYFTEIKTENLFTQIKSGCLKVIFLILLVNITNKHLCRTFIHVHVNFGNTGGKMH